VHDVDLPGTAGGQPADDLVVAADRREVERDVVLAEEVADAQAGVIVLPAEHRDGGSGRRLAAAQTGRRQGRRRRHAAAEIASRHRRVAAHAHESGIVHCSASLVVCSPLEPHSPRSRPQARPGVNKRPAASWRRSARRLYCRSRGKPRAYYRESAMTVSVRTPTIEQVLDIADSFGLHLTVDDAKSFQGIMAGTLVSYARVDEMVEPKPAVKYPR